MYMDFCYMAGRFALAVYLDPGIFQLCDPYTLQPFIALTLPMSQYCFMDHFLLRDNQLLCYNDRQMLMIELDSEVKGVKSIYHMKTDLIETERLELKVDYKYPKKGMFAKVHTIQESLDKYEK